MFQTTSLLALLLTGAAPPEADAGLWSSFAAMLPWLLLAVVVCAVAVVVLTYQRRVVESRARDEIRVLIESSGQTEQMWAEKCEGLERKLERDLARQEKHLRRHYRQKLSRCKEEILHLREQNLELKESVSQLMQGFKSNH